MGRLEKKTSRTAGYTCMNRAAAFYDKNPFYHIDDDIAAQLLPKILNFLLTEFTDNPTLIGLLDD